MASENIVSPKDYSFFQRIVRSNMIQWHDEHSMWQKLSNRWVISFRGKIKSMGVHSLQQLYRLKISVGLDSGQNKYSDAIVSLFFKKELIAEFTVTDDEFIRGAGFAKFLRVNFGFILKEMIHDQIDMISKKVERERLKKELKGDTRSYSKRFTRRKYDYSNAQEIILEVRPVQDGGHEIGFTKKNLETGEISPYKVYKRYKNGLPMDFDMAKSLFYDLVVRIVKERFVGEEEKEYIPESATKETWDFEWNRPKIDVTSLSKTKLKKKAQSYDYQGYFTGNIPDYAVTYMGTSSVDDSQIKSMFYKADEAIALVNKFDASLLRHISFIFNFSRGGAYGVYLSELDRAIKTEALKRRLQQKGYTVELTDNGLTAFPAQGMEIDNKDIQRDIDNIYQELESKGGSAIGINMNAILSSSRADADKIGSEDPNIWEWITILHLGETIVHEATHAKGARDEAGPEAAGAKFTQWALPMVNEKYKQYLKMQGKEELFSPLEVSTSKRYAKNMNWYKKAQMSYYIPKEFTADPTSSDLEGRHPSSFNNNSDYGMSSWAKMSQFYQNLPIENKLGRQFMSPLPPDLDQHSNSMEEQLRKYTRDVSKADKDSTLEELLWDGHDEGRGYEITENLLDEKRVKPLMVTLQKNAKKFCNRIYRIASGEDMPLNEDMEDNISNDQGEIVYHGSRAKINPMDIEEGHGSLRQGIYMSSSIEVAKQYGDQGSVLAYSIAPDANRLDLSTGEQTMDYILDNEILEKDDIDVDLENYILEGRVFQADPNNTMGIIDDVMATAKSQGYDVVYLFDDLGGESDNVATVILNKHVLTPVEYDFLKDSSRRVMIKQATVFGWMNNLEISDGSTIPGLSDRVMSWGDRDESFAEEESWIRSQPRYNPSYDIKGFYYRWIEPRWKPELFDDMTRDYSNTHPAKRFASKEAIKDEWAYIISILNEAKCQILKSGFATRFMVSEDLMVLLEKIFDNEKLKMLVFEVKDSPVEEKIYAVWVVCNSVSEDKVEKAEKSIQKIEENENTDDLFDELFGKNTRTRDSVERVCGLVEKFCYDLKIPCLKIIKDEQDSNCLVFDGGWGDSCFTIGSSVAEKLGVKTISDKCDNMFFDFGGVRFVFKGE